MAVRPGGVSGWVICDMICGLMCDVEFLYHVADAQDEVYQGKAGALQTCDDLAQDLKEDGEEGGVIRDWEVLQHAQALDLQPG